MVIDLTHSLHSLFCFSFARCSVTDVAGCGSRTDSLNSLSNLVRRCMLFGDDRDVAAVKDKMEREYAGIIGAEDADGEGRYVIALVRLCDLALGGGEGVTLGRAKKRRGRTLTH